VYIRWPQRLNLFDNRDPKISLSIPPKTRSILLSQFSFTSTSKSRRIFAYVIGQAARIGSSQKILSVEGGVATSDYVQELLAFDENRHYASKAMKHKGIVLDTGGARLLYSKDEQEIYVDVDATQLESPGWQQHRLVPPRAFPELAGEVDGVALVSQATVEGGGAMSRLCASFGGLVVLHQVWSALAVNEDVTTVHLAPKNQALLPTYNVIQGAIVNSGQKRSSDEVEQPLSFAEQVLNCGLLSQVVILMWGEAAYDESLEV
jgi:hypothetical protein